MSLPEALYLVIFLSIIIFAASFEYYARKLDVGTSHSSGKMGRVIAGEVRALAREISNRPLRIVDPGSGAGNLAFIIARVTPEAIVTGLELALLPFVMAKARAAMIGPRNVRFLRQSFYDYDYAQADIVIAYLPVQFLERLESKFRKELPAHAAIISNSYPMPAGWTPYREEIIEKIFKRSLYCYRMPL